MSRFIDLSLTLRSGMRGVDWETSRTVERDGWNARTLHLYSHAGTHMDAQTHFAAGMETIDLIPLERCLGSAWVVDLPDTQPRALIEIADLRDIAARHRVGESLLFRTGWSRHVEDANLYRDQLPRLSESLAHWCVDHRVNIVGVEPPSIADVNDRDEVTRIHKILLGGNVTIVEGLTNLSAINESKVLFGAFPLKIAGGDGCPCRAFAIEGGDLVTA
jgi:arylformamidase